MDDIYALQNKIIALEMRVQRLEFELQIIENRYRDEMKRKNPGLFFCDELINKQKKDG